ncbi:sulfotransferase family protein [Prochlorococcus marinus]|uniref:Sulfotransferase domain-containing protein n=1 Tax=Prochlorococcus marinus (strain MIT 9303) TaxID=59922 RepID=A2C5X9_PROM3|nr:sulfotransferase [Prochlorococcus marinus]ABM76889.1 Hypothetical protein P9303_01341 [Prochlorococcus marinus str. MIT 9303]
MNNIFTSRNSRSLKRKLGVRANRPLPHFLGIGTQKGGTTSLYWLLRTHSEIFLPEPKELQYFTLNSEKSVNWYSSFFDESRPGQLRAEITPYYLFHPAAPKRILKLNPAMKMIVLLRDPVERALSQYFHAQRLGFEDLSPDEAFAAESNRLVNSSEIVMRPGGVHVSHQKHSYLNRSCYDKQIRRYYDFFSPSQFLIIRSEDFFAQPDDFQRQIECFLDLSPFPPGTLLPRANEGEGKASTISNSLRERLRSQLEPTYSWLENELGLIWPFI